MPFRIAFQTLQRTFEDDGDVGYLSAIAVFDASLIANLFVKALVAYLDDNSVLVADPKVTVKNYLSNKFLLDAIAAFPLDYLVSDPMRQVRSDAR